MPTRKGAVSWAAPEVLKGQVADARSDVYSFGVILWELATREIPKICIDRDDVRSSLNKLPKHIPAVKHIIWNCFKFAGARPTFETIYDKLYHIIGNHLFVVYEEGSRIREEDFFELVFPDDEFVML